MGDLAFPFLRLMTGVGAGVAAPMGWLPVAARPLVVLVGVTGVGKSTVLAALAAGGLQYHQLPDRRFLTDELIIAAMQLEVGEALGTVTDRRQRFAYTRRYAQRYPGGMAHALAQLHIDPQVHGGLLLFDGLRGVQEVAHASDVLPDARFVVLEAPDVLRVARLMGRQDPFDQIAAVPGDARPGAALPMLSELERARDLFAADQIAAWMDMVAAGIISASDLRRSLAIVVEERRNYDPTAAGAALRQLAPERTCVIDTSTLTPDAAAARIMVFIQPEKTVEG